MVDLDYLRTAVNGRDFDYKVCRGLLDVLAEVEQLRAELAALKRIRDEFNRIIAALSGAHKPELAAEQCVGWLADTLESLQAEVKSLRVDLALERQKSETSNDILLERHAVEERRLRAELDKACQVGTELEELYQAERARCETLEKALPEAELLERAAEFVANENTRYEKLNGAFDAPPGTIGFSKLVASLRAAAARIREAQEAQC